MNILAPLLLVLFLAAPTWGAEIRGSGGGGGVTGWPSNTDTKEITTANSLVNAICIGAGTNPLCIYEDGTLGPLIRPQTDANTRTYIWNGFTWCLYDIEGDACMLTVDPDAASPNAMYQFSSGYRPVGTIYFDAGSISVDGTNCTAPTEQALNSAEKTWAFSCGDSNSSIFSGKIRMPKSWDLSTVTFTLSLFHGTTETITFAGDFSAQCRGAGDAINGTYGTAVASDVSITTANLIAEATTAAVTPNGTCAAEDWLLWRYVVDAANFSANAANSKVLGVTIKYSKSSWSD